MLFVSVLLLTTLFAELCDDIKKNAYECYGYSAFLFACLLIVAITMTHFSSAYISKCHHCKDAASLQW